MTDEAGVADDARTVRRDADRDGVADDREIHDEPARLRNRDRDGVVDDRDGVVDDRDGTGEGRPVTS